MFFSAAIILIIEHKSAEERRLEILYCNVQLITKRGFHMRTDKKLDELIKELMDKLDDDED